MKRQACSVLMTRAILFCGLITATTNANVINNGGFESGDFTGWTATSTNGLEELTPWTVGGPGGGHWSNTSPLEGSFDAYNGFDGDSGLEYDIFQDITIAANSTASLITNHRIQYDGLRIPSRFDRVFEIGIFDLADTLLENLYSESITLNGAGYTDLGWNTQVFDLTAYSGSTVRLQFHEFIPEGFTGPASFELDGISLEVTPVPVPGAALLGFIGMATSAHVLRRRRKKAAA